MSFYPSNAVEPTPGLAFEAFQRGVSSPMLPHAPYRPEAAGPMYLATDGVETWGAGPQVPSNLRGLGVDASSLVAQYVEPYLDKTVQGVINRNWPVFEQKLNESLMPLKVLLGLAVVASGTAAIVGYMSYQKNR